jgi:hypothetical protein
MWNKLIRFQAVNDNETLKSRTLKNTQVKLYKAIRRVFFSFAQIRSLGSGGR